MVKVKICGITNIDDALQACRAGADALGCIFYSKSPRYISPELALRISSSLPKRVKRVGVFFNAPLKRIKKIDSLIKFDYIQLHGEESPQICELIGKKRVIKTIRLKDSFDHSLLEKYRGVYAFLFDSLHPKLKGGSGRKFDWKLLDGLRLKERVFISGGLNYRNVSKAIRAFNPDWVDVSSGVEISPGKKNAALMRRFVDTVRGA